MVLLTYNTFAVDFHCRRLTQAYEQQAQGDTGPTSQHGCVQPLKILHPLPPITLLKPRAHKGSLLVCIYEFTKQDNSQLRRRQWQC